MTSPNSDGDRQRNQVHPLCDGTNVSSKNRHGRREQDKFFHKEIIEFDDISREEKKDLKFFSNV